MIEFYRTDVMESAGGVESRAFYGGIDADAPHESVETAHGDFVMRIEVRRFSFTFCGARLWSVAYVSCRMSHRADQP